MKKLGLKSIVVKRYRPNSNNKKIDENGKKNLLDRDFKSDILLQKLVGDITYIYTKECGWTYLAIVMDLASLKIIGYSYGKRMTEELVIEALNNVVDIKKYQKIQCFIVI